MYDYYAECPEVFDEEIPEPDYDCGIYYDIDDNAKTLDEAIIVKSENYVCDCPVCGSDVENGYYSIYCKGKCGFSIGRVYDKYLSVDDVRDLVKKRKPFLTIRYKGDKLAVYPEIIEEDLGSMTCYKWMVMTVR